MDTDLVVRAQHGDKGAYALMATEIADRYLAVARRILRDMDLAEAHRQHRPSGAVRPGLGMIAWNVAAHAVVPE